MTRLAKREYVVIGILLVLILLLIFPALRYSRRELRDGQRRETVAAVKTDLEQYFNKHNKYPLIFEVKNGAYVVEEEKNGGAEGWYVRTVLENAHESGANFDFEEGHNYFFRYVKEDRNTYYDVCGGTYMCGLTDRPMPK